MIPTILFIRKEPYEDMEAIQVALGVLHDGLRPSIPDPTPKEFAALMRKCWEENPDNRPVCFLLSSAFSHTNFMLLKDFKEILETLQVYYNSLPQVQDPATLSPSPIATPLSPTSSFPSSTPLGGIGSGSGIFSRQLSRSNQGI